jgi:RimJ/RimL family protein N-acetyltransferase
LAFGLLHLPFGKVCHHRMSSNFSSSSGANWREELPTLAAKLVTLREPVTADLGPLTELLSIPDASRFGMDDPVSDVAVKMVIDRAPLDRRAGLAITYTIVQAASRQVIGLTQVRQLDPTFETAEWEMTLAPSARGTGVFLEAARLIGSLAFASLGTHRLEARIPAHNGRANGALRKLGAVQEGLLRRSARRGQQYIDQVLWSLLKDDWSDHWVSIAPRVH